MNCTLCLSTDADLDCRYRAYTDMPVVEDSYTTTPVMEVVKASYRPLNEEALHTSFEEAISDRVLAVHERLSYLAAHAKAGGPTMKSGTSMGSGSILLRTAARETTGLGRAMPKGMGMRQTGWRRTVMLSGLALMFMLLGFDVMGLLVLWLLR